MKPTIAAVGEVLWDIFPDGPRFGGAPANFACAVAGLSAQSVHVALVSAVGKDELGDEAVRRLQSHGVDTSCVNRRDEPTGQVNVTLDDQGRASYRFVTPTAWDHIMISDVQRAIFQQADLLYFGTLAQRAPVSRSSLHALLTELPESCLRLCDVNLRAPYWSKEVIADSLKLTQVVKLNDDELPIIAKLFDIHGTEVNQLQMMFQQCPNLKLIALTKGAKGSLLLAADGTRSEYAALPIKVVDTVGAGDAFTAALVLGLLKGMPLHEINRWASQVAAFVCTQSGGTPMFPREYCLP